MNVLLALLPLTLLFIEGHGGYTYSFNTVVHHGSHSGGSTSYNYQSGGSSSHHTSSIQHSGGSSSHQTSSIQHSGGSPSQYTSSVHSGGSSSSGQTSSLIQNIMAYHPHPPPYNGMPQGMGSAPQDGDPQSTGPAPQSSKTTMQLLATKTIVDVFVDDLSFKHDRDARELAKHEVTKCIANSKHAATMMHDKDLFAETFDWYRTMCECHYNKDSCPTSGWYVVPVTLFDVSIGDIKDLSMDAMNSDENTFELQKWMVTRAVEVACIDTIAEEEINSFNGDLDNLIRYPQNPSHELQRYEVQAFFQGIKMEKMEKALRSGQHECFDESAKENIEDRVKEFAGKLGISCIEYGAMSLGVAPAVPSEAELIAPLEKKGNLRPAPFNRGQLGRAPGT